MTQQNTIKPLTIEISKELWERFKLKVPRNKTLNQAIVELIEKKLSEE